MWRHDPRALLFSAFLLDLIGQIFIIVGIYYFSAWLSSFYGTYSLPDIHGFWFLYCCLIYPLLGWLFGSYTVLRWRRLAFQVLFQRLFITAIATFSLLSISSWLIYTDLQIWLASWKVQLLWLSILTFWSLLVRLALRRGLILPDAPSLLLLAAEEETPLVLEAWARVSVRHSLRPVQPGTLETLICQTSEPLLVALTPSRRYDPSLSALIDCLEIQDPSVVQTTSVISLFEQQQGRVPPALLADSDLLYDELPWAAPFSVQAQLKRLSDLFVAIDR